MYAAIAFLIFAAGLLAGFLMRRIAISCLIGAACWLPLLTLGLFYLVGSRSGCAGGDCGPAIMLLGLLAIPAALAAVAGTGLLFHGLVAAVLRSAGANVRTAGATAFALGVAIAGSVWFCAYQAFAAPPERSCIDRVHVAVIAGKPVRFVVAPEVALLRPGSKTNWVNFFLLGDAADFCRSDGQQPLAAETVSFRSDPFPYAFRAKHRSGLRRLMAELFSSPVRGWSGSICSGPLARASRALLCDIDLTKQSIEVTFERATQPFNGVLWNGVPNAGPMMILNSADLAARLTQLPDRERLDGYTIARGVRQWMIVNGPVGDDPLGLPRLTASCSVSGRSTRCTVRFRISARLAADTLLNSDALQSSNDVLPLLKRLTGFAEAVATSSSGKAQ